MSRWMGHFGLREAPFTKDISATELWVPKSRVPVIERLVDACRDRGHAVLAGEPGVGKTCVLRALRQRLPQAGFRLTYCHNVTLGRRDFYRHVCIALGLSPKATAAAVFFSISSHIAELGRENVHPVLLIDEAHLLHQDVLDHLHILANYEWDQKPLLSIVLVGLPEIRQRLALAKNRSLWSRVHTRISLGEASAADTAEYVGYRMKRAGADREVFNEDSVAIVHEHAQGRLREIDRICTDALRLAAKKKARVVDREVVGHVIEHDLDDVVDD